MPITPPAANGLMPPVAAVRDLTATARRTIRENSELMLAVMPLATGLNAAVTARLDSRSASDLSTSSNFLPPITDWLNARDMAPAKPLALIVSAAVRALDAVERAAEVLRRSDAIHRPSGYLFINSAKRRARQWRAARPVRPRSRGKLARRHAPEMFGRKPQDAEPDADRLLAKETAGQTAAQRLGP